MSAFRVVLVFLVTAMLGLGLASRLSLSFTPRPLTSSFVISYSLSEATPLIIEQQATAILENALSQIDGIKKLYSISGYESGTIELEFDSQDDLAFKKIEILTTLRSIKSELPASIGFPTVNEGHRESEQEEPLLIYAISSLQGLASVQEITNHSISPKISAIHSIRDITISGTNQPAISISFHASKLKAANISFESLTQAIRKHASVSFQNSIIHDQQQLPLMVGNALGLSDLKALPITSELALEDLSNVTLVEKQPNDIHRINGKAAIMLSIYAHKGVNRIVTANRVEHLMKEFSHQQSTNTLSITKRYDDTTFLREEINKAYYRSACSILILSCFILLFTLKWRQLIVLFSGLVVNIGMVLLFTFVLDLEIHLYTLAGLTVSFGLLVDNALVMLDHYAKYRNKKILSGLMAASLTTVVAVGIILFLPEEDRQNLTDSTWIVMLSLSCSLVVAWLFTPAMATLILKNFSERKNIHNITKRRKHVHIFKIYHQTLLWLLGKRRWVTALIILAFGLPVFLLPSKWEGHEWYNSSIGQDYYQDVLRPYVDRFLGGSSRLFYKNVFEGGGFRNPDKTRLYVRAKLPFGHTIQQMNHTIKQVEDYLNTVDGVATFLTYVYSGQNAQIIIEFNEDQEQGSLPYILKSKLTSKALDWGGVEWDIYGVGRGFSNATGGSLPSFRVKLKGHQFDQLSSISDVFAKKLLAHKRIQAVNTNDHLNWGTEDFEELRLHFNNRYFQYAAAINETMNTAASQAYQETPSLYMTISNERLPVYLEKQRNVDFSPHHLMHYTFGKVPLHGVSKITHKTGTPEIHKENRQYLRMVSFDYFGNSQFGQKYLDRVIGEMNSILPAGFEIKQSSYHWFSEKEKRQYQLIPLLIIAIYLICVVFFENFKQPLLIIFIIPTSFIGLFLIFAWGDFRFDQGGYAAFLMLGGLVVNSAIFVFSDYQQQTSRIQSKRVTRAIYQKAWPITLTVISTCVGLVPFLINGDNEIFWFSLAIGMIGGLCFSTLVVFFVLPIFMIKKGT